MTIRQRLSLLQICDYHNPFSSKTTALSGIQNFTYRPVSRGFWEGYVCYRVLLFISFNIVVLVIAYVKMLISETENMEVVADKYLVLKLVEQRKLISC